MTKSISQNGMCESCMMPFKKDPSGVNREHEKYCSYCFRNGNLCYQGNNVREFKKVMMDDMLARGENPIKAKFFGFMAGFAPRWRKS